MRDCGPLIDDILLAPRIEGRGINATRAHNADGGAHVSVQIGHAEEALVQVAFHIHLEGQIVVLKTPTGAIKGRRFVEAHPIVEDRPTEQAILRPGDQVRGLQTAAVNAVQRGAGAFPVWCLPQGVRTDTAQPVSAVFHVAQHGKAGEGHNFDVAVHEQHVIRVTGKHVVDDLVTCDRITQILMVQDKPMWDVNLRLEGP